LSPTGQSNCRLTSYSPTQTSILPHVVQNRPGAAIAAARCQRGPTCPRTRYYNLLFTWRQRYRHLVDAPVDDAAGETGVITDNIVPVVLERQLPLLPVAPAAIPTSPPRPEQTCEIVIDRARLKLSGHLTPAMLATLVRERSAPAVRARLLCSLNRL